MKSAGDVHAEVEHLRATSTEMQAFVDNAATIPENLTAEVREVRARVERLIKMQVVQWAKLDSTDSKPRAGA